MDGDSLKEKAKANLKAKVRKGAQNLTKEQKKEARQRLVAETKAAKAQPHTQVLETEKQGPAKERTPNEWAHNEALDLRERLRFLAEKDGAYRQAWAKFFARDGSAIHKHMATLAEQINNAEGVVEKVLHLAEVPADLVAQLQHTIDVFNTQVTPLVSQVDAALRKEVETEPQFGDALQVLDGVADLCDAKSWEDAVKAADRMKGKVVGSGTAITAISEQVKKYYDTWNGMGTDGLKGAKYADVKQLADIRLKIVMIIAESREPFLMACCRPGTAFYNYIKSLAAQSCSSRDVQMFEGWWQKNLMTTG